MNTLDTQKNIIATGTLPKNGKDYIVVLQTHANIKDILNLHNTVQGDLPEDKKTFIRDKDSHYIEKHLGRGGMIIGVICEGQLIAQSMLTLPTADNPGTGMMDMQLDAAPEDIAVLHGMIVHPDYRRNGLMPLMVDLRIKMAEALGRTHVISEADARNPNSWSVLMAEGLELHSIGLDQENGSILYNMHAQIKPLMERRARSAFNKQASPPNALPIPANDIEQQKGLLCAGFKGVAFDKAHGTIAFTPPVQKL